MSNRGDFRLLISVKAVQDSAPSNTEASHHHDDTFVCRPADPGQMHRWNEAIEAINFYLLGAGYHPQTRSIHSQSEHQSASEKIVPPMYGGGA